MNIEVVYYVQQFYEYVQSWKAAQFSHTPSTEQIPKILNSSNENNNINVNSNGNADNENEDSSVPVIDGNLDKSRESMSNLSLENDDNAVVAIATDNNNDTNANQNNQEKNNTNENNANNNLTDDDDATKKKNALLTRMDTVNLLTPVSQSETESLALPIG